MNTLQDYRVLFLVLFTQRVGCVFREEPGPVYGVLGDPLRVPCLTDQTPDFFYWKLVTSDDELTIADRTGIYPNYNGHYEMIGNAVDDFSLQIKNVRSNESQLRCDVIFLEDDQPEVKSAVSEITVVAVPYGNVQCSATPSSVAPGDELTLVCESLGGLPAASLQWKNEDTVVQDGPGLEVERDEDGRGGRLLQYTLRVQDKDIGQVFTCTANSTAIYIKEGGPRTCRSMVSRLQSSSAQDDGDVALIVAAVAMGLIVLFLVVLSIVWLTMRSHKHDEGRKKQIPKYLKSPCFRYERPAPPKRRGERDYATLTQRGENPTDGAGIYEQPVDNEGGDTPRLALGLGEVSTSETQQEDLYLELSLEVVECKAEAVQTTQLLRSGALFEVYIGRVRDLQTVKPGTEVVVKTIKKSSSPLEAAVLMGEIKAMKAVRCHPNVMYLLAHCTYQEPLMAIFPKQEGNLKTYLKGKETPESLTEFALDVASALAHLSAMTPDILHRCLSAEHVLVSNDGQCKVTGFGFAEDVREREEYERRKGIEPPVRWMAPEQLQHQVHSKMSDVWSFGVLLWEIYSCGETPYSGLATTEIRDRVIKKCTLEKPEKAPNSIYDTMTMCWETEEHRRPRFDLLQTKLKPVDDAKLVVRM